MYKTQIEAAKQGIITPQMEVVAKKENMDVEILRDRIARGTVVIPANRNHKSLSPEGIGEGLKTKINVNLGISGDCHDYEEEFKKVRMSIDYGAEAIMDLSNYGKTHTFRQELIDMSPAMIGTVPLFSPNIGIKMKLCSLKYTPKTAAAVDENDISIRFIP